jgi:predicted secreted protein
MAAIRGNKGVINFGSDGLANITSYTLDTTQDSAETSAMGSTTRTFIKTMHGFSGSADFVLEDGASTAQFEAIAALDFNTDTNDTVTITVLPEGTGGTSMSGEVIVTGMSVTTSFDGAVTGSCTFQGTGALTLTGV